MLIGHKVFVNSATNKWRRPVESDKCGERNVCCRQAVCCLCARLAQRFGTTCVMKVKHAHVSRGQYISLLWKRRRFGQQRQIHFRSIDTLAVPALQGNGVAQTSPNSNLKLGVPTCLCNC
jgi:hypothetical protein